MSKKKTTKIQVTKNGQKKMTGKKTTKKKTTKKKTTEKKTTKSQQDRAKKEALNHSLLSGRYLSKFINSSSYPKGETISDWAANEMEAIEKFSTNFHNFGICDYHGKFKKWAINSDFADGYFNGFCCDECIDDYFQLANNLNIPSFFRNVSGRILNAINDRHYLVL